MTEIKLREMLIQNVSKITKILRDGYDCEIRLSSNGLKIIQVKKTVK